MNTGILLNSLDYLRTTRFNLIVSLSIRIYKILKIRLYTDDKFKSAIIRQDLVIANYLSKYVIHHNINIDPLYFNYESLNICKKAKLLFIADVNFWLELFDSTVIFNFSEVILFLLDNFGIKETNRITYIIDTSVSSIQNIETIKKMFNYGIGIIRRFFIYYGENRLKIEFNNYELIHYVCQRNISKEIECILFSMACHKDSKAIDVIRTYTDAVSENTIIKLIACKNIMLEELIAKGFNIQYTEKILERAISHYNNIRHLKLVLKNKPDLINYRNTILDNIRNENEKIIKLLMNYGFDFNSETDDAVITFLKNRKYKMLMYILTIANVQVHKQETYICALNTNISNCRILWDDATNISPEILLLAINMSKRYLTNLLLKKGIRHKDMLETAINCKNKIIIKLVTKYK